jgi:F-type H+-transporting ATPase subunit b
MIDMPPAMVSVLHHPYTWISLSFIIFVVLAVKYLVPVIGKGLDARADKIREQLEQASRLRADAQALLVTYQEQQQAMLTEAAAIIEAAKADAAALRARAAEDLTQALERRTKQAHDKIARAEIEAVTQIRTQIIEQATASAREMIRHHLEANHEDPAIANAIASIGRQIH